MNKDRHLNCLARLILLTSLFISKPAISSEKESPENFQSANEIVRQLAPGHKSAFPSSSSPTIDLQVNFKLNSSQLSKDAKQQLTALGKALNNRKLKGSNFIIAGHTDASGSIDKNQKLSEKRAQTVLNFLTTYFKINPKQLSAIGYGESRLKDIFNPNSNTNRRVEVQLIEDPIKNGRAGKTKW